MLVVRSVITASTLLSRKVAAASNDTLTPCIVDCSTGPDHDFNERREYNMKWLALILPLSVSAQWCDQAQTYTTDCEFFTAPHPDTLQRCYSWSSGSSDVAQFQFLILVDCGPTVSYELFDSACVQLDSNATGGFSITPYTPYIICVTIECSSIGGVHMLCPREMESLPVELVSFVAQVVPSGVLIRWTTASERDSEWFVVLRGSNLDSMKEVATLGASHNSAGMVNYVWTDADPLRGLQYYRLDLIDTNGSRKALRVIPVTWRGIGITDPLGKWTLDGKLLRE
jgi:hypothetical protein